MAEGWLGAGARESEVLVRREAYLDSVHYSRASRQATFIALLSKEPFYVERASGLLQSHKRESILLNALLVKCLSFEKKALRTSSEGYIFNKFKRPTGWHLVRGQV